VGERAAIPKEVIVIDQMPLTPVGKIFKPALRWDAIRRVYEAELHVLGQWVQSFAVTVKEDKVHGTMAHIRVQPAPGASGQEIESKVREALARFTVKYRLEIERKD